MKTVDLFGLEVCSISSADFTKLLTEEIKNKNKKIIFDLNTYNLYLYKNDSTVKRLFDISNLIFADGASIVLAAKILKGEKIFRYTGVDRMYDTLKMAQKEDFSVFLLGSTDQTLSKCRAKIKASFSSLTLCGYHNGFFDEDKEKAVVELINSRRPNILLIGMPTKKTASFLVKNIDDLPNSVIMPVGGSFEILSGEKKRAPQTVQKLGMEWLYRLLQDPQDKLKRYTISHSYFFALLLKETVKNLFKNSRNETKL